ncbi:hypothetical protein H5410_053950 [Solanum commersonii]|uniref:2,4-dienoyl-CoA reductase n=1 Tax=Solanum commersonii TaxID=4109 RepID=A0A9J5X594_SOLCO|nr:hypothetical protein H5410_053950 [Solanum commersonii]
MEKHAKSVRQLEPWVELAGKVVMVTGASSGIGRDFCSDLSKAGCRIIAAARRIDRLQSLCDEINSNSSQDLRAVAMSLTLALMVLPLKPPYRKLGIVHSPLDLSEEEWEKIYKTNLRGAWLVTKFVCKHMRAVNQGGSVINISSIADLNRGQLPGGLAYASSKEALNSITKVLALELGPCKIRVNSISPVLFKSEITEGLIQKDWLQNIELRTIPLRTHGTSNPALTSVVRYLIHNSSEYVSGNMFIVDAGATLPGVPIFSSL